MDMDDEKDKNDKFRETESDPVDPKFERQLKDLAKLIEDELRRLNKKKEEEEARAAEGEASA